MAKLTDLFTEDGVEYSERSFPSEHGIEGLGDEPFVSSVCVCMDTVHVCMCVYAC